MFGRGAAASSHDADAILDHAGNGLGVLGRVDVKDGVALVVHMRQAGVCLHEHGLIGNVEHALGKGAQIGGTLAAVDAHNVCSQGVKGDGGDFRARAQKRATVLFEGHGGKDGQVGVLLGGKDSGLGLGEVGHGLDDKQVDACLDARLDLFLKQQVRLIKRHGAQGA